MRFSTADDVTLDGDLVTSPAGRGTAVVCHPHPMQGGSMTAGLVPLLQRAFVDAGFTTLRFDFRGVGGSEGRFGGGTEELHDLDAAVEAVSGKTDGPVLLAGWSFGAAVALRYLIDHPEPAGWLGVALAVGGEELGIPAVRADELQAEQRPLTFVHGSEDGVSPLYRLRGLAELAPAGELVVVEGGDHLLREHRDQVTAAVRDFVARVAP